MVLLSAENIEKNFGERILFSELNITLNKGDKAALIAANGTGKSSLLKVLAREDEPEKGHVKYSRNIRIAFLNQEPEFTHSYTIKEQIEKSGSRISNIISTYKDAIEINTGNPGPSSQKQLEEATAQMDISGAWDYDRRLNEILDRFGIKQLDQKIGNLSGGQKKRLALALTLLDNPDILLLDEPTNHLDIEMIEWLEEHLAQLKKTFLMVTHDRYFMENVCNIIYELDNQRLYQHEGNYSRFLTNKENRESVENAEIEKAKAYVRNELDWIRRMPKARTTKSKSRIDSFEEARKIAGRKIQESNLKLEPAMQRLGSKIMKLDNISKTYENELLVDGFSYEFTKGDRIGIIGPNGCGKSTFLNILSGEILPDKGNIEKGETLAVSYYRQQGIQFDDEKKVIDIVTEISEDIQTKNGNRLSASQFLQHYMFSPKVQNQKVIKLSGGEKRRLYLLTVLIKNPNFLILDEPANDLDIYTLHKLESFLMDFQGCLVIVSHDRFILDKLCDHIFIFEGNGKIKDFYGPYSEYNTEKIAVKAEARTEKKEVTKTNITTVQEKKKKGLSFKEKREYEELEVWIAKLEKEKNDLELGMENGNLDYQELNTTSERIGELIKTIEEKEYRWLELDDKLNNG